MVNILLKNVKYLIVLIGVIVYEFGAWNKMFAFSARPPNESYTTKLVRTYLWLQFHANQDQCLGRSQVENDEVPCAIYDPYNLVIIAICEYRICLAICILDRFAICNVGEGVVPCNVLTNGLWHLSFKYYFLKYTWTPLMFRQTSKLRNTGACTCYDRTQR